MRFYQEEPVINEVTMCTVTGFNDDGFTVHLDEYDMDGLLPLHELSSKKIRKNVACFLKIGEQLPLEIFEIDDVHPFMSKKNLKPGEIEHCKIRFSLNKQLFGLSRRLAAISDISSEQWIERFSSVLNPNLTESDHPLTLIRNRRTDDLDIDPTHLAIIAQHHAKLFGIMPITVEYKFTIQCFSIDGMDYVRNSLITIRDRYNRQSDRWSNDELYHNDQAVNVEILPTAIPTFTLKITAYRQERCDAVKALIKADLKNNQYDYFTDA